MLNLIKTLTACRGVSGSEKAISDKLLSLMAPLCDRVWSDPMGSLLALKQGTGPDGERRKILLCAHMDEIGFLVTFIEETGFLRVMPVGGISWEAAAYTTVVFDNGIKGVLVPERGVKPADWKAETFYVDIGAKDKKEAERRVSVGSVCALEGGITRLCGRRITGRPLDDRIGCAILVKIAEAMQETPCFDDVYFVFAVQEEVGCRGSKPAACAVAPDVGLAFDVTDVGDCIGSRPMACFIGGGAAIKLKDSSLICDRTLTDELTRTARENGIRCQPEILTHGGTDTSSIQLTGTGVRAAALSVPSRYIHSGTELIDLTDAEACVALTVAWLRK